MDDRVVERFLMDLQTASCSREGSRELLFQTEVARAGGWGKLNYKMRKAFLWPFGHH